MTNIKHEYALEEMAYESLAALYQELMIEKPKVLVSNNSVAAELFEYARPKYNSFVFEHPDQIGSLEHQTLGKFYSDLNEMADDFENGRKLEVLFEIYTEDKLFYVNELTKEDLIGVIQEHLDKSF